jgi:hypothetical protein
MSNQSCCILVVDDEESLLTNIHEYFKDYSIKYCMNDVIITSKFVQILKDIVNAYGIDVDKIYSAPSLSLKIFIKKYNKNKISFRMKKSEKDLIRNSYFGGRCEVYGNPKFNDGDFVVTSSVSKVVREDKQTVCYTRNSRYVLDGVAANYEHMFPDAEQRLLNRFA